MQIQTKFNVGDTVYYHHIDMIRSLVIKDIIIHVKGDTPNKIEYIDANHNSRDECNLYSTKVEVFNILFQRLQRQLIGEAD